jgi:hypothetical protein
MAFNDVIPAWVINDMLATMPKQYHLDLECPPIYKINEEYFTSVNTDFSWINPDGSTAGILASHVDHPAFDALRKHLSSRGYVEIPNYTCVNGDRVLKPFILNGVLFKVGRKFPCASAMSGHLNSIRKYGDYD